MTETGWNRLIGGVPRTATREDVLTALSNIDAILVRATIATSTQESVLR